MWGGLCVGVGIVEGGVCGCGYGGGRCVCGGVVCGCGYSGRRCVWVWVWWREVCVGVDIVEGGVCVGYFAH